MEKKSILNVFVVNMRKLKRETFTLYFAYRDPRTPFFARFLAAIIVGYALSPIDLIPDFIPVIGYLDDLILIPLGIWLVLKMIPPNILQDARRKAEECLKKKHPKNYWVGAVFVSIWIAAGVAISLWAFKMFWR